MFFLHGRSGDEANGVDWKRWFVCGFSDVLCFGYLGVEEWILGGRGTGEVIGECVDSLLMLEMRGGQREN